MFQLRSYYWSVPWRLTTLCPMQKCIHQPSAAYTTSHNFNLYKVLGVRESATQAQIKSAYYRLCKKHHPDKNDGSKSSQETFSKINEAYSVLGNTKLRKRYDRGILTHRDRMGHRPHHHHQEPHEEVPKSRQMGDQFTASFRSAHSEHIFDEFLKNRMRENKERYQEAQRYQRMREHEYRIRQQEAERRPVIFLFVTLTLIAYFYFGALSLWSPVKVQKSSEQKAK